MKALMMENQKTDLSLFDAINDDPESMLYFRKNLQLSDFHWTRFNTYLVYKDSNFKGLDKTYYTIESDTDDFLLFEEAWTGFCDTFINGINPIIVKDF